MYNHINLCYSGNLSSVREQCGTALGALQRARVNLATGRRGFGQLMLGRQGGNKRSFGAVELTSKHNRACCWTHNFYCLSRCNQTVIPSSNRERDLLLEAGLGEKKVTVPNLDVGRDEFRLILHEAFPKLSEAGDFMFGKGKTNSKYIEILSPYCLTSPRILRDRVGNARTYIIPMQKDLSLSASVKIEEEVSTIFAQCTLCIYLLQYF